jgi:hypothetical protein
MLVVVLPALDFRDAALAPISLPYPLLERLVQSAASNGAYYRETLATVV